MYNAQRLDSTCHIHVKKDSAALAPEVVRKIDENWRTEKEKRGDSLFNGQVLSFVGYNNGRLETRITDYRTFLAQKRDPSLYAVLQVQFLAVSGLVSLGSQIVFGKRAMGVAQEPGKWELAPSGGLTPRALGRDKNHPIEEQFFEELEEELGIPRTAVTSITPFLLVEDTGEHTVDIGLDVRLAGGKDDISEAMKRRTSEYSEVRWIDLSEVKSFCERERSRSALVEVSYILLREKGLIS